MAETNTLTSKKMNYDYIISGSLDDQKLHKFINSFIINKRPRLRKLKYYYEGTHPINQFAYGENYLENKKSSQTETNFPYLITQNYTGFNIGPDGITYGVDEDIKKWLRYNDYKSKDYRMLRDCCIYGKSYELMYIDSDKQVRFESISPINCFDIYGSELEEDELKYFVRFYCVEFIDNMNDKWQVEVYDDKTVKVYETDFSSKNIFSNIRLISETPHPFGMVPVCVMNLNPERRAIFENVINLCDSYNAVLSGQVDNFNEFCDSYMFVKGIALDSETAKGLKKQRIIQADSTDANVTFLTKPGDSTSEQNLLENIRQNIFRISCCPDWSDAKFQSAESGIALQFKLTNFTNVSATILQNMERSLRKRFELYQKIKYIKTGQDSFDEIKITFNQNIPSSEIETAQVISALRGIVSNETLLGQIEFVDDAKEEAKRVEAEKEVNMSLYNFGNTTQEEEKEDGLLEA